MYCSADANELRNVEDSPLQPDWPGDQTCPIVAARRQLTWAHYRILYFLEDKEFRKDREQEAFGAAGLHASWERKIGEPLWMKIYLRPRLCLGDSDVTEPSFAA